MATINLRKEIYDKLILAGFNPADFANEATQKEIARRKKRGEWK